MPIPPHRPEGAPPPPTFNQGTEEVKGHSAVLSDVSKGSSLREVKLDDCSSALLDSKTPTSNPEHPYIRLYQYLHQQTPRQQGVPPDNQRTAAGPSTALSLDKPKGGGAMTVGTNGSEALSSAGVRPAGDGSSGHPPSTRATAPHPPTPRYDDRSSPAPRAQPPLNASSCPSTPPPAPPLEPPICRRGNAPLPPSALNNTPPLATKPPPSPGKTRVPPPSGGSPASSTLAPPPALEGQPQRHNSLGNKRPAPSPGGHTPSRGPAPLPPPSSPIPQLGPRLASPVPAPPTPPLLSSSRAAMREAPPPPYKIPGSPGHCSDPPARGPPPPPPTRNPAAPPAPPPPLRNGHSSSVHHSFVDDFESKYSFHPLDEFPPPDEFKHFTKIYPSKAGRVMRGAPPLPPVGR